MTNSKDVKETPLMKQYNQIKAKYPGALLLFRVGDFYETFGEDAVKASKVLNIVLTKRANGSASHIELAGFPHHAMDNYLPKLVRAGYRVAICDQLEDPKSVKGIVKRGVTELVTPGVSFDDSVLEQGRNNYLASIHFDKDKAGVAFLDISTGEFLVAEGNLNYVDKLVQSLHPSEIIFSKGSRVAYEKRFNDVYNTHVLEDWIYAFDFTYEKLTKQFSTNSLKGFGIENMPAGIVAGGAILYYLEATEHKEIDHIATISRIEEEQYVWMDKFTVRNLELIYSQQEGGVPLINILDKTQTPMGSRMLKRWMVLPLKDRNIIQERHAVVEALVKEEVLKDSLNQKLDPMGDIERLISKVAVGRVNPRELLQLKKSLGLMIPIKALLAESGIQPLIKIADQINLCEYLFEQIDLQLSEEPPLLTNQGNLIKEGIDADLDELRKIAFSGKDFLLQLQKKEKERTGISSLKIAYNRVFGYYLEVSNAHKDKVPQEWIRKQTLVNAERYITEELKVYEEKILGAEDKMVAIEQRIFQQLVRLANDYVNPIQQNARLISMVDCLLSFAEVAILNTYVKPTIVKGTVLDIKLGRHPVIEKQLALDEEYIPNDVFLDNESQQIVIITGPNMAGKSALLRQTALIVLMAQIGSFVPAKSVTMGLVDKIFTRVGASDNLSKGESTFMVEMTETASILNNLSDRSLILMDEIGRGTSTYDGVSIAWSIVEFLHNHPKFKAKTLFATHYHELNQLAEDFPRIHNYNVSVKEIDGEIIFLRKLKKGGSEHSFGIHVAHLAGMPTPVVLRANEIMHHLEKDKIKQHHHKKVAEVPKNNYQLSLFDADPAMKEIKELLEKTDINTLSPVEALLKLNELKGKLK
ncbi:MAG: DNA mismatch repair protein MutS [Marivirga sp.]|jgi:DNA mismatch repair protein MutS